MAKPRSMSDSLPIVSIVTQVYNTGREVVEAMESVRASSFQDWEHIMIDDASTDDSVAVIEAYCERASYPCTFIKHQQNKGIAATRQEIVSMAKGKYIATLSDDLLEPNRLERDVAFLEGHPDHVCGVFGLSQSFDPLTGHPGEMFGHSDGLSAGQELVFPADDFAALLLSKNPIPAVSVTMRAHWAQDLPDLKDFFIEDYPHWVHLSNKGCLFGHRNEVTTMYRDSAISVQKTRCSRVALDALRAKSMLVDNPHLESRQVYIAIWRWYWSKLLVLSSQDHKSALRILTSSGASWSHALHGLKADGARFLKKHLKADDRRTA